METAVAVRAAEAGADADAAVRRARVVLRWVEAAGARWGTVVVTTAPEDKGISKKLPEAGRVLAAVAVEGLFCRPDTAPVEAAVGAAAAAAGGEDGSKKKKQKHHKKDKDREKDKDKKSKKHHHKKHKKDKEEGSAEAEDDQEASEAADEDEDDQ